MVFLVVLRHGKVPGGMGRSQGHVGGSMQTQDEVSLRAGASLVSCLARTFILAVSPEILFFF